MTPLNLLINEVFQLQLLTAVRKAVAALYGETATQRGEEHFDWANAPTSPGFGERGNETRSTDEAVER